MSSSISPISPLFPSLLRPLAMKPSIPIDCRFRPYGCHTRLSKENMEQHMVTATNVHLHLLLSKLTDLERSSRSIDRRVSELESRSGKKNPSWSTTSLPAMLSATGSGSSANLKSLSPSSLPSPSPSISTSLHGIPSIHSVSSLSSVSSEEEHITTTDSRKRRRDEEEEEEMDSEEEDEDDMIDESSPAFEPHVHESLVQVASIAQAVQTAATIPPTWTTSPSPRARSSRHSDAPVSAAALRRRAARRLKRQRALLEGPNVPKKPKTAYNFFQSDSRKSIQQEVARNGPHLTREEKSQQVARVIGERWKALTEQQRIPYQVQADADKERYRTECEKHGATAQLDSPISTPISTSASSEEPISPRSPVSPILSSAFHRASTSPTPRSVV